MIFKNIAARYFYKKLQVWRKVMQRKASCGSEAFLLLSSEVQEANDFATIFTSICHFTYIEVAG